MCVCELMGEADVNQVTDAVQQVAVVTLYSEGVGVGEQLKTERD